MSRVLRTAALAATAAVVALGLSACGPETSTSGAPAQTTGSTPAKADANGPGSDATAGPPAATAKAGTKPKPNPAGTKAPSSGDQPAAATVGRCHTAGLKFSFGTGDGTYSSSDDQQHLQVVLTNTSGAACTVKGFPGVDLKTAGADTWSLVRSAKATPAVTLKPGAAASFVITYLPWEEGSGEEFKAKSLVITPPNETTSVTLNWPGDNVLRQDGATHPGTYTGPVTAS